MSGKTGNYILIGMVLGAILGTLGGYFLGDIFIEIKFLGTIFLNALKMVVIPLIVASIIVGVSSLGDIRKLGRTSAKTLTYYLATTGFSVLIGIILVNLIRPGVGVPPIGAAVPEFIHGGGGNTIKDVFVGLIPDNIFAAAAGGKILPLIVFSLVLGGVLTVIGRKGKPVIDFFVGVNSAMMKIVILIIYFAPIGVMALIGGIVAENRGSLQEIASGLGLYSLTVIIGLLIHAVIVLPLILKFFGKKDPFRYFLNMGQALATAFTTASSSATLPVTMEAVTEKNKVDSKASSFVLPLGATINMDGTALYEAVAAIFIAQIYGIDLSVGAQVIIFFTATLASIGAAAIPEAGLVMMTLVLSAVGLPLEGIGIILVIDWFLDRCRTTVNVWGDSIGAAVIGETEEIRGYRIGGSKTAKTTKRKYTKTTNKKFERSDRSKKSYDKKPSSKTRYTRDSKSREDKGYRKTKDTPRKPISKLSSYESKSAPKPTPKPIAKPAPKPAVKSASKPAIKKSAPPKAHKPYSKTNGDKLIKKKDPVQLSKKSIEKDLEKVHRQLTEKTKYKKPTGIDKDITKEPKLKTKPVEKSVSKKNDFFENGIPKFDFSSSKNDKKTAEDKAIVKKSEKPVDPIKNDDVTVKAISDKKKKEEPVISEMPVISIPSDKKEESQVTITKEDEKPIEAKPAPAVTDPKPTRDKPEPEKKPVEEKTEEKLSASDDKPVKDKVIDDKPTKGKPPEVKQKPKQDKKADMGWGRDKKKRLSK